MLFKVACAAGRTTQHRLACRRSPLAPQGSPAVTVMHRHISDDDLLYTRVLQPVFCLPDQCALVSRL